jgi:hypothetical protein
MHAKILSKIVKQLIAESCQRLLFAKHFKHVENARRDGFAGQSGSQRLCHFSELSPRIVCEGPNAALNPLSVPRFHRFKQR